MIKETLVGLIQDLNTLSEDHDTLIKIDWSSRSIVASQIPGEVMMVNRMWILFDNPKDEGSDIQIISSNKLKYLKQLLREVVNNPDVSQIVPESYGFKVISYKEILFKNQETNLWSLKGRLSLRSSFLVKSILKVISRDYKILYNNINSIKMS